MNDQVNNDGEPKQAEKSDRNDGGGIKRDYSAMSREELERRLAALKQQNAALDQQLAAKHQIKKGRYFALIDDVFQGKVCQTSPTHEDFKRVCRKDSMITASRMLRTGDGTKNNQYFDYYKHTLKMEAAATSSAGAADDSFCGSKSSLSTIEKRALEDKNERLWPKAIFGNKSYGAIAHLIPAAPDQANTFWFITDFLFGYDETHPTEWETRKRLIHGVNKWVEDKNNTSGNGRKKERVENTGIKHAISNNIRLQLHDREFDTNPNVVIIPIYSVKEAKEWKGEGYEAIVLIDAKPPGYPDNIYEEMQEIANLNDDGDEKVNRISSLVQSLSSDLIEEKRKDSLNRTRDENLEAIAGATEFINSKFMHTATRDEITKAHNLVKAYTNAIVYAQTKLAPEEILEPKLLKNGNDRNIVNVFRNTGIVFETELSQTIGDLKVRKIRFYDHTNEQEHPSPDPILLATHAANQLQRRRGIKLVAAAEPRDDDDDDDDETNLFILAQEEFLRYRKSLQQQQIIGTDIEF